MDNTIELVRDAFLAWGNEGVILDLFGGWAEELLERRPPGPHGDIDFVHRGEDFSAIDAVLRANPDRFNEVRQKRFGHKRALLFHGVLCEIILVQNWDRAPVTLFWGDVPFHWNMPFLHQSEQQVAGVPISLVHEDNLRKYRMGFKATENHRWRDRASRIP